MPLIRSYLAFNAYSEGWALYSEQLGYELGAYDGDPLGRLGYLQSIGFRACRLVVDTGLHAKGWSVAQAIDWFAANTGMPRDMLRGEVIRYCAMPGQACGYKMGHNEINRQRARQGGAGREVRSEALRRCRGAGRQRAAEPARSDHRSLHQGRLMAVRTPPFVPSSCRACRDSVSRDVSIRALDRLGLYSTRTDAGGV